MSAATRQRLREVIAMLRTHPEGMSTPEIAERLDVTRQTAHKDISRLSLDGVPIYEEGTRYFLDPTYQTELVLSLAQAWFLYIPLRRIVRADLHRIPLVRSLLHQITSLLHEEIADHLTPLERGDNQNEIGTDFKTLVKCWQEQLVAEIRYRRPNAVQETILLVQPWWFEPAIWSDAYYLVGGLIQQDDITTITLKVDRIQRVTAGNDRFERPDSDLLLQAIEQTWGIWVGEGEATTVRLRFHNRQFDRLQETRWHPTQRISLEPDGMILWEAEISEPQEMLPWIRGWGADVEVLEPEDIRQRVAADAEMTARMYNRITGDDPSFF